MLGNFDETLYFVLKGTLGTVLKVGSINSLDVVAEIFDTTFWNWIILKIDFIYYFYFLTLIFLKLGCQDDLFSNQQSVIWFI